MVLDAAVDALCGRRCAFAWYALPGREPVFCMQADGGMTPWLGQPGFLLAPWCGEPLCLASECDSPLPAGDFPELPARPPQGGATTRARYGALFRTYTSWLRGDGALGKVVLARTADEPVPPAFPPSAALRTACRLYPDAFNALLHTPQYGTWLCCTPEILVQGQGGDLHTMALAGTRPAGATGAWDAKNTAEHGMVVRHVAEALSAAGFPAETSSPETLQAGCVEHLCTRFSFRMPHGKLPGLLHSLAPTPAVAGFPVAEACRCMAACPDVERSLYAGYMGPCAQDSVSLYVTLRCMQIHPGVCRLYAGGGLLPDSDEEEEWLETLAKLRTMRNVLAGVS